MLGLRVLSCAFLAGGARGCCGCALDAGDLRGGRGVRSRSQCGRRAWARVRYESRDLRRPEAFAQGSHATEPVP